MTDRYQVELSKPALKELRRLDRGVQVRIVAALALLRDNPRPPAVKALAGHPGLLRIRVGEYRIVYRIDGRELLVLVLTIGHRPRSTGACRELLPGRFREASAGYPR